MVEVNIEMPLMMRTLWRPFTTSYRPIERVKNPRQSPKALRTAISLRGVVLSCRPVHSSYRRIGGFASQRSRSNFWVGVVSLYSDFTFIFIIIWYVVFVFIAVLLSISGYGEDTTCS